MKICIYAKHNGAIFFIDKKFFDREFWISIPKYFQFHFVSDTILLRNFF